jgi:hypothetical protein
MDDREGELDFAAWLSRPPLHRAFRDCVRAAADSLALGPGGLRERVFTALFCLSPCAERDVPGRLKPDFELIRDEVLRRAGIRGPNAAMAEADFRRLRRSFLRCNIRTAKRLARKVLEMDRALG